MENWNKLCRMTPKQIRDMQDRKLRAFMANQIYLYSPYYSAKLKELKIDPVKVKGVDDLKHLPFTNKEDVAPTMENPGRHTQFVMRPDEELSEKFGHMSKLSDKTAVENSIYDYKPVHMHFTTGRTAMPTPFVYTSRDIENIREAGYRLLDVFNVTPDDVTLNAFPYAPHLAFWQTYFAGEKLCMPVLNSGGGKIMGTQNLLDAVEFLKPTVLVFIPGYAYYFLREAARQGRDFSTVRKVFFGGERVPPGLKQKIKALLEEMGANNPDCLATYGITEARIAWGECPSEDNYYGYHTCPDMEIFETIDPETGENVGEGEEGELVYTALDWRGTSLVRYRTGDVAKGGLIYEPCPNCGRPVPRISSEIHRKSDYREFDLSKVKGTLVNLNNFYPLLMDHPDVQEWQVEIRKRNNDPYDLDEIVLYVSPREGMDEEKLTSDLQQRVQRDTEVSLNEIVYRDATELIKQLGMETELKEKRIVDNRPAG